MNSSSAASDNSFFHGNTSPICARLTSFCSCGTAEALRRLQAHAGADWPAQAPAWLTDATTSLHEATTLAARMPSATRVALCQALLALSGDRYDGLKEHTNATTSLTDELAAVTMRLLAGAALEGVGRREDRHDRDKDSAACRQLWADSAHVAVWTSAHAECACAVVHNGLLMAEPCAAHLPCFLSEIDLSDLFARRMDDARSSSKDNASLKQLLQRATSPGQRGWDSVMDQALNDDALAGVVRDSIVVCLLGLHPQLPPRARAGWRTRQELLRLLQQTLYRSRGATVLSKCPVAVKEGLRRRIAAIMQTSPAEHAALSALQHPVRHLLTPPCALPSVGQQAAMQAFVHAGEALTRLEGVDVTESVALVINDSFKLHSEGRGCLRFDPSWMGKGTISVDPRIALVSMASSAWSLAFRANFLPFWTFCASHGIRASRLDAVQHEGVHSLNSATRLCALLPEDTALHAQRVALRTPSAGLLNVREVASLLGVGGIRTTAAHTASARPACVTEVTELLRVEGGGTAEGAALLLTFARVAAVTESVLTFALGEGVARRQARALLRRFLHPLASTAADEDVVRLASTELPKHAAHAHVCCECRRLATAHVGTEAARTSGHPFNEIGVAATMICRDTASACTELRCAKRSSASLRTALASEAEMKRQTPERLEYDADAVLRVLTKEDGTAAGAPARMRRDTKSVLEQTSVAVPCGTRPMLVVPLLGKAVRIFNEWIALCSLCGAAVVVRPHHRYGGEIACMRCDPSMLYSKEEVAAAAVSVEQRQSKICRFCGKADPERSGQRWRTIDAPLDVAGVNAALPPPLRKVHYCPRHWRGWLGVAHSTLETRCVLSHIVTGARPIHGADTGTRPNTRAGETALRKPPSRKRRRLQGGSGR